jgi:hypothetical protein
MANVYVFHTCNEGCKRGAQQRCDASCDSHSAIPPCISDIARIPCHGCNWHFKDAACFGNYKPLKISGKTLYEAKRRCRQCGVMEVKIHECNKWFSSQYLKNRELGHNSYCILFETRHRVATEYCLCFMISKTQNTKYWENINTCRIWCASNIFGLCARTMLTLKWITEGTVSESIVSVRIPSWSRFLRLKSRLSLEKIVTLAHMRKP